MARPTLFTHPKFRRLVYLLGVPTPHAVGYLECLWHVAYEAGNPVFRDAIDVELAAQWPGEKGKLAEVLQDVGLVDSAEDGGLTIHDFFDHAPDYVQRRAKREASRKNRYSPRGREQPSKTENPGSKSSELVRPIPTNSGQCPTNSDQQPTNSGQCPSNYGQWPELVATPTPTPTPSPTPTLPLTPSQGLTGSESNSKEESVCERGSQEMQNPARPTRPLMPCDDPELATKAKQVLAHYQKVVRPVVLPGQAIPAIMDLLADNKTLELLCRCADGYASWCQKKDQEHRYRQSAAKFFACAGNWLQFVDWEPEKYSPPIARPVRPKQARQPKQPQESSTLADSLPDIPHGRESA